MHPEMGKFVQPEERVAQWQDQSAMPHRTQIGAVLFKIKFEPVEWTAIGIESPVGPPTEEREPSPVPKTKVSKVMSSFDSKYPSEDEEDREKETGWTIMRGSELYGEPGEM